MCTQALNILDQRKTPRHTNSSVTLQRREMSPGSHPQTGKKTDAWFFRACLLRISHFGPSAENKSPQASKPKTLTLTQTRTLIRHRLLSQGWCRRSDQDSTEKYKAVIRHLVTPSRGGSIGPLRRPLGPLRGPIGPLGRPLGAPAHALLFLEQVQASEADALGCELPDRAGRRRGALGGAKKRDQNQCLGRQIAMPL